MATLAVCGIQLYKTHGTLLEHAFEVISDKARDVVLVCLGHFDVFN